MNDQRGGEYFGEEQAAAYDKRFEKIAPMRDNLHLVMRFALAGIPDNARVLCVGAGTGLELFYLAEAFPGWRFTAVEPAAPMLAQCRRRAERLGVASRCDFHEGYLDTLPETAPFDAATALLVSHFILEEEPRRGFFRGIAARLREGAPLVNADLSADRDAPDFRAQYDLWLRAMRHADLSEEKLEEYKRAFEKGVSLLPPSSLAALISSAGFEAPQEIWRSLLMRAWVSRRA